MGAERKITDQLAQRKRRLIEGVEALVKPDPQLNTPESSSLLDAEIPEFLPDIDVQEHDEATIALLQKIMETETYQTKIVTVISKINILSTVIEEIIQHFTKEYANLWLWQKEPKILQRHAFELAIQDLGTNLIESLTKLCKQYLEIEIIYRPLSPDTPPYEKDLAKRIARIRENVQSPDLIAASPYLKAFVSNTNIQDNASAYISDFTHIKDRLSEIQKNYSLENLDLDWLNVLKIKIRELVETRNKLNKIVLSLDNKVE
ncbi:MAG: hypothetical protein ABI425_00215 [Patescibacteria group bacterium]